MDYTVETLLDYVGDRVEVITKEGWIERTLKRDDRGLFVTYKGAKRYVEHVQLRRFRLRRENI